MPANALESIPGVWRGRRIARAAAVPTGFTALDAVLPGNGWPLGALCELYPQAEGIGELRLLLPALRRCVEAGRKLILIRPPHLPYAPAWAQAGLPLSQLVWVETDSDADARWAAEQALQQTSAGALLLWTNPDREVALRRLQLAAQESQSLLFAYRHYASLGKASPAAVRLALRPAAGALRVEVVKARGGRADTTIHCPLRAAA